MTTSHPDIAADKVAKERPILFSGAMVRALLAGTKTQTRRVVKLANGQYIPPSKRADVNGWNQLLRNCPYGQPGDLLWVRESFWGCDLPGCGDQPCVVYDDEWQGKEYAPEAVRPWARKFGRIPSIHMPRDCSRILLQIIDVRVERLQDCSRGDAMAEGCPFPNMAAGADPRTWYADLWDQLGGTWASNPWVWAVSFRRLP